MRAREGHWRGEPDAAVAGRYWVNDTRGILNVGFTYVFNVCGNTPMPSAASAAIPVTGVVYGPAGSGVAPAWQLQNTNPATGVTGSAYALGGDVTSPSSVYAFSSFGVFVFRPGARAAVVMPLC